MSKKQVLSCVERTVAKQAAFKLQNRYILYELVQVMQAAPDGQMRQVYSILVDEKDYNLAISAIKAKDTYNYKPPKDSFKSYNSSTNNKSSNLYRCLMILIVFCALILLGGLIDVYFGFSSNTQPPSHNPSSKGVVEKYPRVTDLPKIPSVNTDSIFEQLEKSKGSHDFEKLLKDMETLYSLDYPNPSDYPSIGIDGEMQRLLGDTVLRRTTPRTYETPTIDDDAPKNKTIDLPRIPEPDTIGGGIRPTDCTSQEKYF